MTPLQRLEALDQQLIALEQGKPELASETQPASLRQLFFGDLAAFWNDPVEAGRNRLGQLRELRHEQLLAELELRLADQTLDYSHISLLRTSLALPQPWQRSHLPDAHRAQVYRPVFYRSSPHGRLPLPGALVLVANAPQGPAADPSTATGQALLCSVSHGVEGFASLAELHTELCERLDAPLQSRPLLQLLPRLEDQQLTSSAARWRMQHHGNINRARMRAEAAKARYARQFLDDTHERGYRWVKAVTDHPDNDWRPTIDEQRIEVRQLIIDGHTLQGVLLINAERDNNPSLVLYTPDAPDRRAWREYPDTRALLKTLRSTPSLRKYLIERAPLADGKRLDTLVRKGRLGPNVQKPMITGNLFDALYKAQVHAMIAEADTNSRSNRELLGESGLATLRLVLDIISLVLPAPAMSALAFGRMSISLWDGFEALDKEDYAATFQHAMAALSHSADGFSSFAASPLMRRAMRGLPPQPPRPMPATHEAAVDVSRLRYRIDGVHGEEVYEQVNRGPGPARYFVKDSQGRLYNVHFDGYRWRVLDPRQPDAYVQLPIKRLRNGDWVVDSVVLWHDGLPDVAQLLEAVRLQPPLEGEAVAGEADLHDAAGHLYLQLGAHQLPVRRHLLTGHYHLLLPEKAEGAVHAWAVLRQQGGQWRIRVRQAGRSSDWLALPQHYSASLGSNRSSR